jgi:hypothetical protein
LMGGEDPDVHGAAHRVSFSRDRVLTGTPGTRGGRRVSGDPSDGFQR